MGDFTGIGQILNIGSLRERCRILSHVFSKATLHSSVYPPRSLNSSAWYRVWLVICSVDSDNYDIAVLGLLR